LLLVCHRRGNGIENPSPPIEYGRSLSKLLNVERYDLFSDEYYRRISSLDEILEIINSSTTEP